MSPGKVHGSNPAEKAGSQPTRYLSTRGAWTDSPQPFSSILLEGLAPDGGLAVPQAYPRFTSAEQTAFRGLAYPARAHAILSPLLSDIPDADLKSLIDRTYTKAIFGTDAITPVTRLEPGVHLLHVSNGPTLAFKDIALQLLGNLFEYTLAKNGSTLNILGATSGDTGSAAEYAMRGKRGIEVFMLSPKGRMSPFQQAQMFALPDANIHNIAIEGVFDDCQDLVKAMFADARFRQDHNLSAVNSINWARIMAQVAYYVAAALALGAPDRPVSFAVPTGNFGNVYAAHVARRMGLPIAALVIGTNRNDILTRFLDDGAMTIAGVEPSLSPSMDIQVSSNFERLYHELKTGDGAAVAAGFKSFRATGSLPVSEAEWRRARELFSAARIDDAETLAEIGETHRATGELLDPHSAVAVAAARRARRDKTAPIVALACAHPAKFPDAVERATGIRPPLPPRLADLYDRPERIHSLPNDLSAVESFITARARPVAAPARAGGGY